MPKIIYNNILPFKGFYAVNLLGLIFVRKDKKQMEGTLRHQIVMTHETIHTEQMKELLYIGFYLLYFVEWIVRILTPPFRTAYRDISFEREAYENQVRSNYPDVRKRFAWTKYLTK